jgi:ABC-2 type transport system permease protein
LYFSRAIERRDYAVAKLAALTTAMLVLTLTPETVLFTGNAFTTDSSWKYLRDNAWDIPRIVASALVISTLCAAVALAIAAQTPRRAYATGGAIALFVVSGTAGAIIATTVGRYGVLISVFDLMRGSTLWIFGESFGATAEYDVPGALMFATTLVLTAAAAGLVLWRYRTVSA